MSVSRNSNISVAILSLIIIIINEPLLSRIVHGVGILALMLLFLLINLPKFIDNGVLKRGSFLLGLSYICIELLYRVFEVSDASLVSYYNVLAFLFFPIVVCPVIPSLTSKQQNIIVIVVLVSILIMMISNIRLANQFGVNYPRIEDFYKGLTNSINTQYFSALIIFCGVLIAKMRLDRNNNIVTAGILIFSMYFIVAVGQRLIAILLLFATVISLILFTGRRSMKKKVTILFLFILGIVVLLNYQTMLSMMADVLNNDRVTRRLNQLQIALTSKKIQGSGGSLEARYDLIQTSVGTFFGSLPNFLFGAGAHDNNNLIIGNHSQWIDQAAKYGVAGCLMLYLTIRRCFKDVYLLYGIKKDDPFKPYFSIIIAYFVIRGAIGAVLYPHFGEMLFLFLPIAYLRITNKQYDADDTRNTRIRSFKEEK